MIWCGGWSAAGGAGGAGAAGLIAGAPDDRSHEVMRLVVMAGQKVIK
jgi:hypothetical protein